MSEIILDFEIFELKSSVIRMNENNEKVVSRITEWYMPFYHLTKLSQIIILYLT